MKGKIASEEFQKKIHELRNQCIKTLTDGVHKELKKEYGKVETSQYVATLYSIYIQFSCGLLHNIDDSLKELMSKDNPTDDDWPYVVHYDINREDENVVSLCGINDWHDMTDKEEDVTCKKCLRMMK